MFGRTLLVCLLAWLCSVCSFAQRPTSNLGSDLEVHVVSQNNRPVHELIQVVLENSAGKQVADAFTNDEGVAMFSAVRPGSYRLRVEGTGISTAKTDVISVYRGEGNHTEYVRVTARNAESSAQGSVSASELKVPESARKQMDRGVEAIAKGDLSLATQFLEKAIAIYPEYARAWNNLGVVKMRTGDKPGAKAAWERAVAVDDKLSAAHLNLARIAISEKHPTIAEGLIGKALVSEPDDPSALLLMSTAKAMNGEWADALTNARKVRAGSEPKRFADAHRIAGEALVEFGQPENAVDEYEKNLKVYPDSPHAEQIRQQIAKAQSLVQAKANSAQP